MAEDERPQRDALEALLGELWPEAAVCASCADGLEALEAFEAIEALQRDELGKHWLRLKGCAERLPVSSAFRSESAPPALVGLMASG